MSKTLYQVFKNLAWPDLCQAALVCKAWREVRVVYSFCFCAETQIGTIVVMVASFPPALFFSFQAAEDPTLWKDFPVLTRMTLANFLGFIRTSRSVIWLFTRIFLPSSLDFNIKVLQSCTHIRSAMAEGFQVDLPCCNKSNCQLHTSNPWPLLQEVLAFSVKDLGPRLKELVLYLSRCSVALLTILLGLITLQQQTKWPISALSPHHQKPSTYQLTTCTTGGFPAQRLILKTCSRRLSQGEKSTLRLLVTLPWETFLTFLRFWATKISKSFF